MAREKETRKELLDEPDLVTVYLHRIAAFFVAYKKPVIVGVVAFLAIVAIVSGYLYYKAQVENKAALLFGKAMNNYEAVIEKNGSPADYESVKKDFETIIDQYGNTKIADMAVVQYASACYRSGDFESAVGHYEKALARLSHNHRFREMAVSGLAYSYEALNDHENAIKHFEIIAGDPNAATRDQALFKLGELYAAAGDPEKSRNAYETIVSSHTESIYYEIAKTRIDG